MEFFGGADNEFSRELLSARRFRNRNPLLLGGFYPKFDGFFGIGQGFFSGASVSVAIFKFRNASQ